MLRIFTLMTLVCSLLFSSPQELNGTTQVQTAPVDKLRTIGIEKNGSIILIDLNRTKHFFESIGKKINRSLIHFSKELRRTIKDQNNTLINIDKKNEKVIVDINRTKTLVESIEIELKKLDKALKEMGKGLGLAEKNGTF